MQVDELNVNDVVDHQRDHQPIMNIQYNCVLNKIQNTTVIQH